MGPDSTGLGRIDNTSLETLETGGFWLLLLLLVEAVEAAGNEDMTDFLAPLFFFFSGHFLYCDWSKYRITPDQSCVCCLDHPLGAELTGGWSLPGGFTYLTYYHRGSSILFPAKEINEVTNPLAVSLWWAWYFPLGGGLSIYVVYKV